MWLASVSKANIFATSQERAIVSTQSWSETDFATARSILEDALRGVGDPDRFRLFRMQITLCMHRACSDDELRRVPGWAEVPGTCLAGGPVEVLESKGVPPGLLSADPCRSPGREYLFGAARPDLWLPIDCGECPPCIARAEIEARGATCAAPQRPA